MKELFPNLFTENKLDWEKLRATFGNEPEKVITLNNLFTGNDQLKTNTVLQMRDAGIDFKTI